MDQKLCIQRRTSFRRTEKLIHLSISIAIVIVTNAAGSKAICDTGPTERCLPALEKAIRSKGYLGPVAYFRNDLQDLALDPLGLRGLEFFEVRKGGPVSGPQGRELYSLGPLFAGPWLAFVDLKDCGVYRMFGFGGDDDYSRLAASIGRRIGAGDVADILGNYIILTRYPAGRVVRRRFDMRYYVEGLFQEHLEEVELDTCLLPLLRREYDLMKTKVGKWNPEHRGLGFVTTVVVATTNTNSRGDGIVEGHSIRAYVGELGQIQVEGDDVVIRIDPNPCVRSR